jgi:hypothetical protein
MGDFAVSAAVAHAIGSRRGERSQLSAAGISLEQFLEGCGTAINQLLLGNRETLVLNADISATRNPDRVHPAFAIARDAADPKRRWIDGTPEYSLHMPALRKLFPTARFIHLVRDVQSVVKSMMLFSNVGGNELVRTEQEAYAYWLRTMQACLAAEKGWGAEVVCRVRYADLVGPPRATIEKLLEFLAEPFAEACLEPLQVRMNSSRVADGADFMDPATDPGLRDEAEALSAELAQKRSDHPVGDGNIAAALEREFEERVAYFGTLDHEYEESQKTIAALNRELQERGVWCQQLDQEIVAQRQRIADLQGRRETRSLGAEAGQGVTGKGPRRT